MELGLVERTMRRNVKAPLILSLFSIHVGVLAETPPTYVCAGRILDAITPEWTHTVWRDITAAARQTGRDAHERVR